MSAAPQDRPAVIGIDFGTGSVRAVVVATDTGVELGEGEYAYQRGTDGVIADPGDPHLARQSPRDYLDGLRVSVEQALVTAEQRGFNRSQVVAIGVDSTGSTPMPVDAAGNFFARTLVTNWAMPTDATPPTFAGVESAFPGDANVTLRWTPAQDNTLPITYSLEGMRLAILKGHGLGSLIPTILPLLAFAVVMLPLSLRAFQYAVRRAKMDGTLTHY